MEDLQNEANPFIMISQTKIWTKTVQHIFNHMLGLLVCISMTIASTFLPTSSTGLSLSPCHQGRALISDPTMRLNNSSFST